MGLVLAMTIVGSSGGCNGQRSPHRLKGIDQPVRTPPHMLIRVGSNHRAEGEIDEAEARPVADKDRTRAIPGSSRYSDGASIGTNLCGVVHSKYSTATSSNQGSSRLPCRSLPLPTTADPISEQHHSRTSGIACTRKHNTVKRFGVVLIMEGQPTVFRNHLGRDVLDMDPIIAVYRPSEITYELVEKPRIEPSPRLRIGNRREEARDRGQVGKIEQTQRTKNAKFADGEAARVRRSLEEGGLGIECGVEHDNTGRTHPIGHDGVLRRWWAQLLRRTQEPITLEVPRPVESAAGRKRLNQIHPENPVTDCGEYGRRSHFRSIRREPWGRRGPPPIKEESGTVLDQRAKVLPPEA